MESTENLKNRYFQQNKLYFNFNQIFYLKLIKDLDSQHQREIYLMTKSHENPLTPEEQQLNDKKRDIALKALHHYTNREDWESLIKE